MQTATKGGTRQHGQPATHFEVPAWLTGIHHLLPLGVCIPGEQELVVEPALEPGSLEMECLYAKWHLKHWATCPPPIQRLKHCLLDIFKSHTRESFFYHKYYKYMNTSIGILSSIPPGFF